MAPDPRASRPRLLDLCCGAGGASAGYHAAGFDVTGVDLVPQPDYPYPFVHADALTVDLSGYDVIAASPPCQRYSTATPADRRADHPDLIAPIRARLRDAVTRPGRPWAYVIENVPGAPLVGPVTVCGETMRLGVRRHRLFESNAPLAGTPCWHDGTVPPVPVYGSYGQRGRHAQPATVEGARAAMGIEWMPWPALTQAIPPAYTWWIGLQLIAWHARDATPPAPVGIRHPDRDETNRPEGSVTRDASPSTSTGIRHCRHCGRPLPPRPATGRWPRHCSHACRQAAYRARTREASR